MEFYRSIRNRVAEWPTRRRVLVAAFALLAGLFVLHPGMGFHHRPPHRMPARITQITLPDLALGTPDGWRKQVRITEETRIHRGPERITAQDLKVGSVVLVDDRPGPDDLRIAVDVDVAPEGRGPHGEWAPPPGRPLLGFLASLAGFLLVLRLARRASGH